MSPRVAIYASVATTDRAGSSTIARQVGVSQRTVERFVRTILDDLGASTRFQAGAQAERAGLL